jgi:hypothetical protein
MIWFTIRNDTEYDTIRYHYDTNTNEIRILNLVLQIRLNLIIVCFNAGMLFCTGMLYLKQHTVLQFNPSIMLWHYNNKYDRLRYHGITITNTIDYDILFKWLKDIVNSIQIWYIYNSINPNTIRYKIRIRTDTGMLFDSTMLLVLLVALLFFRNNNIKAIK